MQIALTGAPLSGKTAIAQQLLDPLREKGSAQVIDEYVPMITKRSDVALGYYATYIGNIQVAIGRYELERRAKKDGAEHIVTVGTLADTIAHEALRAVLDNSDADPDQMYQNYVRTQMSMELLGVLYKDTWDYDYTFFVPLSEERKDSDEYVWSARVNEAVRECLEELKIPHIKLGDAPVQQILSELEKDATSNGNRDSEDRARGQEVRDSA